MHMYQTTFFFARSLGVWATLFSIDHALLESISESGRAFAMVLSIAIEQFSLHLKAASVSAGMAQVSH